MSTRALVILISLLIGLLFIRFITFPTSSYSAGQEIILAETLLSQPRAKGTTQQFWVAKREIYIIAPRFPEYHYGETIRISGILQKRLLDNDRSITMLYFPQIELIQKKSNKFLAVSGFVRQRMEDFFQSSLPPTSASLLLGIVLGLKENMPKEFFDDLQKTGTLHVVAASGMNVSMVGGFLVALFTLILRRQIALFCALLGLLFYAGLAGFEPSIVRATLMGGLAFSAQILGRQNLALLSLFLSGVLMLWIDPPILWDIGFQLSFLATLGLIGFKPLFDRAIDSKTVAPAFLKESFTTTLSAQIATLPILIANFGSFFLWSVFANMLVLWTVPIIMVMGALAALVGFLVKPMAIGLLYFCLPLLLFFEQVVGLFGELPGAIVVEEWSLAIGAGYYLVLLGIVMIAKDIKRLRD